MSIEKIDSLVLLFQAMVSDEPSDAILHQEKHGQGQVVMNEVLPIDCDKAMLESIGFVFGDKADELFYNVSFPKGWTRQATDHSMYTDILDNQGRIRGSIGYKAAFYDRWAIANLLPRYSMKRRNLDGEYLSKGEEGYHCVTDWDGTEVYKTDVFTEDRGDISGAFKVECRQWLSDNYPDYKNPLSYW